MSEFHSYVGELHTLLGALPYAYRAQGAIKAISHAFQLRTANRLWSRSYAARVAFLANCETSLSRGRGSKARRRAVAILAEKARTSGLTFAQATRRMRLEREASLAAERYSEARVGRHTERLLGRNPHD